MVLVTVNRQRVIGRVDPNIFGSFIENLHRCIYGGVFDPASPASDARGFRTDVITASRAMGVSNVRFPGGCFAPYYHWRDGVGAPEDRPQTLYRSSGDWPASNAFGTDEFLAWCRELDAEPYICVNMGSGTAEEARDWVEYCNGAAGSRIADLRIANGHPEPYNVKYWALGNEISAPWEFGYTQKPEDYLRKARDFALAMKAADPSIRLVISGAHFPIDFPERDWNREVLEALWDVTDYLSIHHYIGHDYKDNVTMRWQEMGTENVHYHLSEYMSLLDDAFGQIEEDIRLVGHLKNSRKTVGIALDEYNPWYKTEGGKDELVERFPLADALLVGSYFSTFLAHASSLTLANMAQLVNTIPAIVVRSGGEGMYRQGISYVQEMFLPNKGLDSVDVWVDSPAYKGSYYKSVPYLQVSATAVGDEVILNVVNRNHREGYPLELDLGAAAIVGGGSATRLGGADLNTANSFEAPFTLVPAVDEIPAGSLYVAPASVTVFRIRVEPKT